MLRFHANRSAPAGLGPPVTSPTHPRPAVRLPASQHAAEANAFANWLNDAQVRARQLRLGARRWRKRFRHALNGRRDFVGGQALEPVLIADTPVAGVERRSPSERLVARLRILDDDQNQSECLQDRTKAHHPEPTKARGRRILVSMARRQAGDVIELEVRDFRLLGAITSRIDQAA